jgi:2-succinyl-5-enolpyruvyl-6-hydroxy-3-cyclohexene-1-carboxylate synthase
VICSSGTAVANLLPSVVEASQSNVPLLLLTADRWVLQQCKLPLAVDLRALSSRAFLVFSEVDGCQRD